MALYSWQTRPHCDTLSHWQRHFARDAERSRMAATSSRRALVARSGAHFAVLHSNRGHFSLDAEETAETKNILFQLCQPGLEALFITEGDEGVGLGSTKGGQEA